MKQQRQYLELQADAVERTFAAHDISARVTGGSVGPRFIRFNIVVGPEARVATLRNMAENVALALRVASVRIDRKTEGIVIEFENPNPRPVTLPGLTSEIEIPPYAAVLGLNEDGVPLLARLSSPDVPHILIAGTTGSGKTELLRCIAGSLALANPPAGVQLLAIDPKGRLDTVLGHAPHLARPVATTVENAAEILRSLVHLMDLRSKSREASPRVVLLIDELADLLFQSDCIEEPLTRLLQRSREAAINVIAATQRPSAAVLSGLMRANFPLRLVGRVISTDDSKVACGQGGIGAHLLSGRGDFLAVGAGVVTRFQAPEPVTRYVVQELTARYAGRPQPQRAFALPAPQIEEREVLHIDPAVADAADLRLKIERRGRQPRSINEAAEWLFGAGKTGGQAFYRARAAMERISDLQNSPADTTTTRPRNIIERLRRHTSAEAA